MKLTFRLLAILISIMFSVNANADLMCDYMSVPIGCPTYNCTMVNIIGGTRKTFSQTNCSPGCPCTPGVMYECTCNPGTTLQNQGTSSCNCKEEMVLDRCAPGYYGDGITCTRCPVAAKKTDGTDVYGTTGFKNTSINDCYLPPGTYLSDSGIYETTDGCTYDNKIYEGLIPIFP